MPSLAIGQTMQPPTPQLPNGIPEPATLVGDVTGTPYIRMGDNPNGREMLSVIPPPGPVKGGARAKLPISAAVGYSGPVGADPTKPYDPLAAQYGAQQQVYDSRQSGIDTARTSLGAQTNVYNAVGGTFAPAQAKINADRAVLPAEAAVTGAQRGYIGSQQTANNQRIAEEVGIQNAQNDTADQSAIARAQQYRNSIAYKSALGGVADPIDIATASGADEQGLPAGVRAKLTTRADLLTSKSNSAETLRKLKLAGEALGVDALGLNVDDLKRLATSAGLDSQQAQQAVDIAKNAAGIAGLGEKAASLNTDRAQLDLDRTKSIPSDQVVYQDPSGGQARLVSPAEKLTLEAQDKRNFDLTQPGDVLYTDPITKERSYMSQDEANQRKAQYERDFKLGNAGAEQQTQTSINTQTAGTRYSNSKYGGISTPDIVAGVADGSFNENEAVYELTHERGLSMLQAYQLIVTAQTTKSGGAQVSGAPVLNGGQ